MTIVVAAASPDGIVLGADSRTTLSDGHRHRISTDAADKVFDLGDFGVATYGLAVIGQRTINGLMDEFIATNDEEEGCTDVEEFTKKLADFFNERYEAEYGRNQAEPGWSLGFIVAGYDGSGIGHIWEIGIPGPVVRQTNINTIELGALWRGQVDVIGRLVKGVDWNALAAAEISFDETTDASLGRLEYVLLLPLTLQDAVDMTSFLVRTTIDMQRFSDGTALAPGLIPGCGGRTQILAVTRSGVDWIRRRWLTGPSRPGWAEGGAEFDA